MKKLFLICCFLFATVSAFAAELNPAQQKLRSDIMSYLKSEGYMPEIDSDGDIKFKSQGDTFFVRIDPNETSPMYVVLFSLYNKPSNYNIEVVKLATAELNFYKGVKVLVYDNGTVSVQADLFMQNADTFKAAFKKLMTNFGYVEEDILDECRSAAAYF